MQASGIVTLLTDFGLDDAYVGAMKGAILAVNPKAAIVDLTHGVRPFQVLQGAFLLDSAWRSFPAGTVHIGVVDPGVGTNRKAIAFRAAEHFFVGPDNGLFTFLNDPINETVELATPPEAAPTFHGRDIFGPTGARIAAGAALAALGSARRQDPVRLSEAWASKVGEAWKAMALHCDRFGDVISNLPIRALARIKAVNGTRVRTVETYDDAEPNELVALMGSSDRIEFALREGSAAARLHVAPGDTLVVT